MSEITIDTRPENFEPFHSSVECYIGECEKCSGCAHECEGDTGHPVPTDMPGFEGTREALDALTIKPGGDGE